MEEASNRRDDFLRTEYGALAEYFGKVITFRFTTAAFFVAAVALVVGIKEPTAAHHCLLFFMSLGIWIIELRNRAIFHNLLRRAWQIERKWASFDDEGLPLFMSIAPSRASKEIEGIPEAARLLHDQTRILWFENFQTRKIVSHTVGLDVLYFSVMVYSLWSLWGPMRNWWGTHTMDPVAAILAFGILFLGYRIVRVAPSIPSKWSYFLAATGSVLIIGAGLLILATLWGKS